jgi:hypothetical protein
MTYWKDVRNTNLPEKGLVVFTIDVGHLPTAKAEHLMERWKERISPDKPEGWRYVLFPVRPPMNSKVEVFIMDQDEDPKKATRWVMRHKHLYNTKLQDKIDKQDAYIEELENKVADMEAKLLGASNVTS